MRSTSNPTYGVGEPRKNRIENLYIITAGERFINHGLGLFIGEPEEASDQDASQLIRPAWARYRVMQG